MKSCLAPAGLRHVHFGSSTSACRQHASTGIGNNLFTVGELCALIERRKWMSASVPHQLLAVVGVPINIPTKATRADRLAITSVLRGAHKLPPLLTVGPGVEDLLRVPERLHDVA